MDFNDNAGLDTSQISDQRGMGGLGGGGLAVGGTGIVGLLIYVAMQFLGGPNVTAGYSGGQIPLNQGSSSNISAECRTGADADQRQDCRAVAVVNSVQAYWGETVKGYRRGKTVLFSNSVSTGCGSATSAVGPFYCPADETIYIDLDFFSELSTNFGAKGGPFAEAYVIAHEYGHHVQNLVGTNDRVNPRETGPTSGSVRLELQADCFAGVWANHAEGSGLITSLTDEDIAVGLDAAAAVGDDRIQEAARGRVSPEAWTHGSAEQRQRWFTTGYRTGNPNDCDTFAARSL